MSLKTYINDEIQAFRKVATQSMPFGLQLAPDNTILGIHGAYPVMSTAQPTSIDLVKIATVGTFDSLNFIYNYKEIERISLPIGIIQYNVSAAQYLADTEIEFDSPVDECIYFIEFTNGSDTFKTEAFKSDPAFNSSLGPFTTITINPTASFEVGILHEFTGNLSIDWGDGGPIVPFVSNVELLHTYSIAATYVAKIYGNRSSITKFVADNSRIIGISDIVTGLLNSFVINDNLIVGELDLSLAPVSGIIIMSNNSGLNNIIFASSGNDSVSDARFNNCNFTSIDLDTPGIEITSILWAHENSSLASILFKSGSHLNAFKAYNCSLTSLDLQTQGVTIANTFEIFNNSSLTSLVFANAGNSVVSLMHVYGCNLTTLDLSNVPISGDARFFNNTSLSSLTFAAAGNGVLTFMQLQSCSLPNINFSVFPNSDGVFINLIHNSMTATEHDDQVINLAATTWIDGELQIETGNTARTAASDAAFTTLDITNNWDMS